LNAKVIKKFIVSAFFDYTEMIYGIYEEMRKPTELYVHHILKRVIFNTKWENCFGLENNELFAHRLLIGQSVDEFIRKLFIDFFGSKFGYNFEILDDVVRLTLHGITVLGKPDIIIWDRKNDTIYILEVKFTFRYKPNWYWIIQTQIYNYLAKRFYGKDVKTFLIVAWKYGLDVHEIPENDKSIEKLLSDVIKDYKRWMFYED